MKYFNWNLKVSKTSKLYLFESMIKSMNMSKKLDDLFILNFYFISHFNDTQICHSQFIRLKKTKIMERNKKIEQSDDKLLGFILGK